MKIQSAQMKNFRCFSDLTVNLVMDLARRMAAANENVKWDRVWERELETVIRCCLGLAAEDYLASIGYKG